MVLDNRTGADALIGEGPGQPGGDRPPESLERLRYFPRQLLTPADLTQEQDYFRARRRRHNRLLHGWGILGGCAVRPGTGNWTVQVEPGLVLSPQGDEIYIEQTVGIDLSHQTPEGYVATSVSRPGDPGYQRVTFNPGAIIYLAVAYAEFAARPVRAQPLGADDPTRFEYSRLRDGFILRVLDRLPASAAQEPPAAPFTCTTGQVRPYPDYPADPWVVLARITIGAPNIQEADIDSRSDRRYVAGYGDWWFKCSGQGGGTPPPLVTPPRVQAVRLLFTHGDPTDDNPTVIGELPDPAQPWRIEGPAAWPNTIEFQFAGANVDFVNIALGTHLLAPDIRQPRLVPMLATNSLRLAGIFTPRDYTVTLRGDEPAIHSTDGERLDGEPVQLPSGDGTAGGNFSFRFTLVAGQNQPPPPRVGTIRLLRTEDSPSDPNPEALAVIRQVVQRQRFTVPVDHWPNAVEIEFTTAAVDLAAIQAGSQVTFNGLPRFDLTTLPDSNRLRLIGELRPGAYTLTLRGDEPAIRSLEGRRLDGEPAQLPSGDGTEGGNFSINFEIVAGPGQSAGPRIRSVRIVRTGQAPTNATPEILFTMQDPRQPIRVAATLSPEAVQAQAQAQVLSNQAAPLIAEVQAAQAQLQEGQQQLAAAQQQPNPVTRQMLMTQAQQLIAVAAARLGSIQGTATLLQAQATEAQARAAQLAAQSLPDGIDIEFTGAAIDPDSIVFGRTCLVEGPISGTPQIIPLPDNVVRIFAPLALVAGTYRVTLRGDEPAIRSTQGERLDGEPNQLPSGDGTQGGNFSFSFDVTR